MEWELFNRMGYAAQAGKLGDVLSEMESSLEELQAADAAPKEGDD